MGSKVKRPVTTTNSKKVTAKQRKKNEWRGVKIGGAILVLIVLVIGIAISSYTKDVAPADDTALAALESTSAVTVTQEATGVVTFAPASGNATTGFIFYPDNKVENLAYAPLMRACAERGIFCVLAKMPMDVTALGVGKAKNIVKKYDQIENWYIGGHGMGASMAATYLDSHAKDFEGLIMLAGHTVADLANVDLACLSIYGSQDKVMDMDIYTDDLPNLPTGTQELIIQGGNYSQFGSYGGSEGDGAATISADEQVNAAADAIAQLLGVA